MKMYTVRFFTVLPIHVRIQNLWMGTASIRETCGKTSTRLRILLRPLEASIHPKNTAAKNLFGKANRKATLPASDSARQKLLWPYICVLLCNLPNDRA